MKVRVTVDVQSVHVDEVIEGASGEEVVRRLRRELEARASWLVRMALRGMDDPALWRKIVQMHNERSGSTEPPPESAAEFLAFAERAGYVTRLD
jgi:hypothetical protein